MPEEFFKTERGRKFYEKDFPALIYQMKRIADSLEKGHISGNGEYTKLAEQFLAHFFSSNSFMICTLSAFSIESKFDAIFLAHSVDTVRR